MSVDKYTYFAGFKKERHWSDITEEENHIARLIQEAAIAQQNANNGPAVGNAGAGGTAPYKYFNPNAAVSFSVDNYTGQGPLTVQFTNTGDAENQKKFATYSWTFGDGLTSTADNPSYIYTNTGSYSSSLTMTTLYGNTSTTSDTLIISSSKPVVAPHYTVSPTSSDARFTASFTNTSTNGGTYLWLFGDGGSSSLATTTVTHIYTNTGSYTVTLQATSSNYTDLRAVTSSIAISSSKPSVVASFTYTPTASAIPFQATFTNTSTNAGTYLWLFGDGGSSSLATSPITHIYTTTGSFTITLQATSSYFTDLRNVTSSIGGMSSSL